NGPALAGGPSRPRCQRPRTRRRWSYRGGRRTLVARSVASRDPSRCSSSRFSRTTQHVVFSSSPTFVDSVLHQDPGNVFDRDWCPLLATVEREDLTDLPDDVAELIQPESFDRVRVCTGPVSVEDEV